MAPGRLLLPLLLALLPAAGGALAEAASEQTLRAALLFNFVKFTEWPTAAAGHAQLRVCIATGDPAQAAAIEALANRLVRGVPIVTVRTSAPTDCNVIYVDSPRRWKELADKPGRGLTIGSYTGFIEDGGMIGISLQDGNARFDVNLYEVKRAGLHINPQVLRLARRVLE